MDFEVYEVYYIYDMIKLIMDVVGSPFFIAWLFGMCSTSYLISYMIGDNLLYKKTHIFQFTDDLHIDSDGLRTKIWITHMPVVVMGYQEKKTFDSFVYFLEGLKLWNCQ